MTIETSLFAFYAFSWKFIFDAGFLGAGIARPSLQSESPMITNHKCSIEDEPVLFRTVGWAFRES